MQIEHENRGEKPGIGSRMSLLAKISFWQMVLQRVSIILAASLLLGLIFGAVTKAQDAPNLFLVPIVTLTPTGAAVFQPQTGAGYEAVSGLKTASFGQTIVQENGQNSSFASGAYIAPKYDAFGPDSMNQKIPQPEATINNVEYVDFFIRNNMPGVADASNGTTKTVFTFQGEASYVNSKGGLLEYRWDFENDGEMDSYFSSINSISHVYSKAGDYQVKMEVLDQNGRVSSKIKPVHVANGQGPKAVFKIDKASAPINSVINFDSSYSSHNQYPRQNLVYRFDWNGDGVFETTFQNKTSWNHQFSMTGHFEVIMEARDPEGMNAKAKIGVDIVGDTPPMANFSVNNLSSGAVKFDASKSSDDFTPLNRLRFRWDFDYNGDDDIIFDTFWGTSPIYTAKYRIGGNKTVRLQVMDEQGNLTQTFKQIEIPWTDALISMAVDILSK